MTNLGWYAKLLNKYSQFTGNQGGADPGLAGVHVFRWIQSTVAVAPHVFTQNSKIDSCAGYLAADLRARISPGHVRSATNRIERTTNKIEPSSHRNFSRKNVRLYQIGDVDLVCKSNVNRDEIELLDANDVFDWVRNSHSEFRSDSRVEFNFCRS